MTAPDRQRRNTLLALSGAAIFLIGALAVGDILKPRRGDGDPRIGTPVFDKFSNGADDLASISIRLADDAYTLERRARDWVMVEAGGFPVREDRLSVLAQGLSELTWGEARTDDIDKLDRLALGDPREGGAGALLEVESVDKSKAGQLITGRKGDRLYGRRPDEIVSFRLSGELPPLYTREAWLDLRVVDMQPGVIQSVRIIDRDGEEVLLSRTADRDIRDFRPAPPFERDELVSRLSASSAALALSRLAPVNVKPASALQSDVVGRHITSTFDGLEIEVAAFRDPGGGFITLYAVEAGEGAARAQAINERAGGWAFELTELDWAEFAPPVRSIVNRAASIAPPSLELGPSPALEQ